MSFKTLLIAATAASSLFSTASNAALGDSLYASGGDVTITFEGSDAAFDSLISINGSSGFFPNHATAGGSTVDLGVFAPGTLLDVALTVANTDYTFHTFAFTMAAPAVPEPQTYALLLGGFGALGFMVRRRGR